MAMLVLFSTVILISLSVFSMIAVYRVGDSAGWTIIDHLDYKKWASTKRFHVGDTLIFSYHNQYHDVTEMSHEYIHRDTNSEKAFYHSDSINLTKAGDFYFICSNSGYCLAGQKLHIKGQSYSTFIKPTWHMPPLSFLTVSAMGWLIVIS